METSLRQQLISFLTSAQAHMTFLEAVDSFPVERINDFPPNVDYTPWMLMEHIRITQKDIVDFLLAPTYKEQTWPDEYWPKKSIKADKKMWEKTIVSYTKDLNTLTKIAIDKKIDLSAKVKNGDGQIILRELLLIIDHTAYHIGEFAILRQIMGTWPKGHK